MEEKTPLKKKLAAECGMVQCQDPDAFPMAMDLCEELSCRLETAIPGIELNELSREINGMRRISAKESKQILAELDRLAEPAMALSGPRYDGVPYTSWQISAMESKIQRAIDYARSMVNGQQPLSARDAKGLAAALDSAKKLRQATKARQMTTTETWQFGPIYVLDAMPTSVLIVLLIICMLAIWLLKKSADHFPTYFFFNTM